MSLREIFKELLRVSTIGITLLIIGYTFNTPYLWLSSFLFWIVFYSIAEWKE